MLIEAALSVVPVFDGGGSNEGRTRKNIDVLARHRGVEDRQAAYLLIMGAQRQYENGNFAEAIIYYYSHQLVQLDRCQLIRLTKGKTNRQYLREIAERAGLFDLLTQSVQMFEDVFFGHHALNRERFEAVWRRQDQFDSLLEQTGA